jgi:hypothetical protein
MRIVNALPRRATCPLLPFHQVRESIQMIWPFAFGVFDDFAQVTHGFFRKMLA